MTAFKTTRWVLDSETGCHVWQLYVESNGYGRVHGRNAAGRKRPLWAHRVEWETVHGPIPEGMQVDHLCRNRRCVNPAHMELVTSAENTRRAATLTWEVVREIRASVESHRTVAHRYGVSRSHISRIRSRKKWWPDPAAEFAA